MSAAQAADEKAVGPLHIADMLGVSTDTVRRNAVDATKRAAGTSEIPGFKLGKLWRFYPSVVEAHFKQTRDPWAMSSQSRHARRAS